jgi:hypothetical protein
MHKLDTICSTTFIKKDKFQRINLFIQNLLIYSERQKNGINSLKIRQIVFQKNLWTGQFEFIKIHISKSNKIPYFFS